MENETEITPVNPVQANLAKQIGTAFAINTAGAVGMMVGMAVFGGVAGYLKGRREAKKVDETEKVVPEIVNN